MNIKKIILNIAKTINENKNFLNDLDQSIGDGDHGTNLDRGFEKVKNDLEQFETATIDVGCMKIAMDLISSVGGSSGPLFGTLFLTLSTNLKNKELNFINFVDAFAAATAAVAKRGNSTVGQKTMNDVLIPFANLLKQTANVNNTNYKDLIKQAKEFAEGTKPMLATRGRASYLKERSIGTIDPGA